MGPAIAIKAHQEVEKPKFVRNLRIARLRELVRPVQPEIDPERLRYMTAGYKETEGQSMIMRRARALDKILSEMTIYSLDGELVVGNQARSPMAAKLPVEYGAEWIQEQLDTFPTRKTDRFSVKEEEKPEMRDLLSYWDGKSVSTRVYQQMQYIGDALGHAVLPGNVFMGFGHHVCDFGKVIDKGVKGIKQEIDDRVKRLNPWDPHDMLKYEFFDAMNITLDALVKFAHRYATYARELAARETDPKRKKELEQIAQNCRWVPENPARTFWQALQTQWLVQVVAMIESVGYSYCPGRVDQYLYPLYRKDIDNGNITREWAQELVEAWFCKFQETTVLLPNAMDNPNDPDTLNMNNPEGLAGEPVTQLLCIGGLTPDGKDATNELSHLMLDADMCVRLQQPELSVRLHEGTQDDFLRHCAEYVRCGTGKPKFFLDETVIKIYNKWSELSKGNIRFTDQDILDYVPVGCAETNIPGKTANLEHPNGAWVLYGRGLPIERVLTQGKSELAPGVVMQMGPETPDPRTFTSFDQFMDAFKMQANGLGMITCLGCYIQDEVNAELAPCPFQSTVISDCIEKGLDFTRGGARYNFMIDGGEGNSFGLINQANGLAAIKKLVFDEKIMSMDKLIDALQKNWEGYEDLRQLILNRAPKFGNDDDYVDALVNEAIDLFYSPVPARPPTVTRGAVYGGTCQTVSGNVPIGKTVGATADGRLARTPLNDGGISPHLGTDVNGPTAILNSMCKLDFSPLTRGTIWNLKFSPQALEGEKGISNFASYLRAFIKGGPYKPYHLQVNCLENETLKDAQEHPENYRNLLVRVAGYSAFFTELDRDTQNMLIDRTEHGGF